MYRNGPAGVTPQIGNHFAASNHGVTGVALHDDVLARVAEEDVPRYLTVDGLEFVPVIVVADLHFVRLDFFRKLIEHIGGVFPAFDRVVLFRIKLGYYQVFVADDFIEFDGLGQVVAEQRVELGMSSAASQTVVVPFRLVSRAIVSFINNPLPHFKIKSIFRNNNHILCFLVSMIVC
jgi:hypothetical protein